MCQEKGACAPFFSTLTAAVTARSDSSGQCRARWCRDSAFPLRDALTQPVHRQI